MSDTQSKYTMNCMGRDEPLYHLFYSQIAVSRLKQNIHILYFTEDQKTVQISEATRVDDKNVGNDEVSALLEEFKSRFPDGEYRGRGIWASSRNTDLYENKVINLEKRTI